MTMKQAIEFIDKYNSFAVAAHLNPEGDAIGSTIALALIVRGAGKSAFYYSRDPIPKNMSFLPGLGDIIRKTGQIPEVEAVIVLDCGDLERTGPEFAEFASDKPILNIDHHQTNNGFGAVSWVEPEASSTGEMIAELARAMKAAVSPDIATCIYTAILTDTGSFQFSNTSPRTLRVAADMIEAGARPEISSSNYYHAKPAGSLLLLAGCLATLEFNQDFTRGDIVITTEMFEKTKTGPDAAEGIINLIADVETLAVAVVYRQTGQDQWKVSLRSKGETDVAKIAAGFKGGGHKNAAGCSMSGDLDQVKETIRKTVDLAIESQA